jgi:tRNA A-37 threonylcarbamoyl transferase component Bud32
MLQILEKTLHNNYTSTIIINKQLNIVEKIIDYDIYSKELFDRELFWLTKLSNTGVVPKVIDYDRDKNSIIMEYCGEVLSQDNTPDNVYEQLYNISIILLKNQCLYNDWKYGNFVINNNKIFIIDFGWCPLIIEDYTCNSQINSNLNEKPSGNFFNDILKYSNE